MKDQSKLERECRHDIVRDSESYLGMGWKCRDCGVSITKIIQEYYSQPPVSEGWEKVDEDEEWEYWKSSGFVIDIPKSFIRLTRQEARREVLGLLNGILEASGDDMNNAAKNNQMYWNKARSKTKEAIEIINQLKEKR